jgi:rhamnose transport system permease protein
MTEPPTEVPVDTVPPLRARLFPNGEWVLLLVLVLEGALFGITGPNFLTTANAMEVARLAVEVGLLALALTPIILTGGIDLSVGSMMGLSAVVLGALWRDGGVPMPLAILLTLAVSLAGGATNAVMIGRLGFPPLIVTLGTYSLFRGAAEGLTRGIENYSGFGAAFLFLGQGYVFGFLPAQLVLLAGATLVFAFGLQRTGHGRSLYAIGFSAEGARHAGIPVKRRFLLVYTLSGLMAGLAAVVYVAHLGQAKADAGTGFELMAITAVVLGGASIFGGRGTVLGTVLGLFAIVVLQNGLRLSGAPAELAGILTGTLLVATILVDRLSRTTGHQAPAHPTPGEDEVKNSQVVALSTVILGAALLVVGGNWLLVRSLRDELRSLRTPGDVWPEEARRPVVAMMPKAKGDPYFISCRQGAEEAAREIGVELLWDGPTDLDPAKQNEVVEAWITRGVDVIAVSVENEVAISTVLRKARARGIKVVTWDADAQKDARDVFINQATPQGIGTTLADGAARLLGGKGDFAIVTASLSAANQNEWIKHIKALLAEKHAGLRLVAIQPSDGDRDRAFAETQTLLKVYPGVKVVMAIASYAVPGVAEAVQQSGRKDVKVTGLSLPNLCKPYVKAGVVDHIVLWNTLDLGYLTVHAARALVRGEMSPGTSRLKAGRLGDVEIRGDQVMLGAPFVFTKDNIDGFDF